MTVTKEQLLASRLVEDDVELDGVGTVRIRSLSRYEVNELNDRDLKGLAFDCHFLSLGMVDPVMTPEDVEAWSRSATGPELGKVVKELLALSGLNSNAAKEAYKSAGEQS